MSQQPENERPSKDIFLSALTTDPDPLGLAEVGTQLSASLWFNPWNLWMRQFQAAMQYFHLWQYATLRMWGIEVPPVAVPDAGDKRFKYEDWEKELTWDVIKQSYLIASRFWVDLISSAGAGLDEQTLQKADFFARQFVSAMAPTNFALTNPEVLEETRRTGGLNLSQGLENFKRDIDPNTGMLRIKMADPNAFTLGKDIATTPGKVVYQNRLMQLIQFKPATPNVNKRPLLVVPPIINKYYIMDLKEKNSLIKWLVAQGHTVFLISWVNPDASYAQTKFDDYLSQGTLAALDAIEKQTGEKTVNAIGYCIGGTLLGCTLAYMAAVGDNRIGSATFFTTMLDFSEPGELGVFLSERSVAAIEQKNAERGYLEGAEMAGAFSSMKENDLMWSFWINNYLMGRPLSAFDMLYWNSDSTNMPAAMHSFYLRNMYLENNLCKPGGITLLGQPIDLSKITVPCTFVSAIEDHIAPWKSNYMGARLLGGPVRFVLGGSGHIAGIINPPAGGKYCYWVNEGSNLPENPDEWLSSAAKAPGSWWTDWQSWVVSLAQEMVPARDPEQGPLGVIEDAPGAYCSKRLDSAKTA